ncbi:hypothetical protein DFQ26_006262 [Actinomortierella ambigua]|nr:hypothetical protein DFQ26_006262 [Actinomortierella ambigua]
MTVPSGWREDKRAKFRKVALDAGIIAESDPPERLVLVSEAEAVAEYCFQTTSGWHLRPNEQFLVCNLQEEWFEVSLLEHSSSSSMGHHSVVESTEVSLHLGLEGLYTGFKQLLESRYDWLWQRMQPQYQDEVVEIFRREIVPSYDGQGDVHLRLPEDILYALHRSNRAEIDRLLLEEGYLMIPERDLQDYVFDPIGNKMFDFVAENVPLQPHCMLYLVGQANQPYIVQKLRQMLGVHGIQVVLPPQPDMAIVRGAVYVGLQQHSSERHSHWWFGAASNASTGYKRMGLTPTKSDDGLWRFFPLIEKGASIQPIVQHRFSFVRQGLKETADHKIGLYATAHGDRSPAHIREGHVEELVVVNIPSFFSKWSIRNKVEVTMIVLFDEDIEVLVVAEKFHQRVTLPYPKENYPR